MTKTINVYLNGAGENTEIPNFGRISLATLLNELTENNGETSTSFLVNGSAIDNYDPRDLGCIFAYHLTDQVTEVANKIKELVANSREKITLNVFGFSRGGVGAFLLAQQLKDISPDALAINIAAIDPVPGNFITTVSGDTFLGTKSTISAEVADLTECKNLENLLVLFTNEPIPDLACHAPILPAYPTTCNAEIDVTPGCHMNAVSYLNNEGTIANGNRESFITLCRVLEFMDKCGTEFLFERFKWNDDLANGLFSEEALRRAYNAITSHERSNPKTITRSMHLDNSIFTWGCEKKYLNLHHKFLASGYNGDDSGCYMTIKSRNPQIISGNHRVILYATVAAMTLATTLLAYTQLMNPATEDNTCRPRP
jgi:hypothetical protein